MLVLPGSLQMVLAVVGGGDDADADDDDDNDVAADGKLTVREREVSL